MKVLGKDGWDEKVWKKTLVAEEKRVKNDGDETRGTG